MFKCNYLDKLKDKTFQKWMISDLKHICEKGAKFGTNGFADKRVKIWTGTNFYNSSLNHSYTNEQRSSIDLKENLLRSLILNL